MPLLTSEPLTPLTPQQSEDDLGTTKLQIGNKASKLLIKAEERARELGHRAVGTGDLLWAMVRPPYFASIRLRAPPRHILQTHGQLLVQTSLVTHAQPA